MKRCLVLFAGLLVVALAIDYNVPQKPNNVIEVKVLALMDAPEGGGWRIIDVMMSDGREKRIKTVTPFFYRAGYKAHVAIYERTLFPDVYDFVAAP